MPNHAAKYPNIIMEHITVKLRVKVQRSFPDNKGYYQQNKGGNPEQIILQKYGTSRQIMSMVWVRTP